MKKKYRHTKAGLWIALLNFNILFSCANTKKVLSSHLEAAERSDNHCDYDLIENAQIEEDPNYCNEPRTVRLVAGLWLMVFVVVYTSYVYVTWWPPVASLGPNAAAHKR
ncbi:hypothetical protein [Cardinium endosymbiont of Sogatella furcifera]|uniref:hypothetical protein n=1 Tax=Cardinium endosymbiont of Sogatella furcifera TaxID=650378 RepID=UPI000E0D88B9|nr:hypothetical protein [Cardinium endosymbiont of Sogatella furcifera]